MSYTEGKEILCVLADTILYIPILFSPVYMGLERVKGLECRQWKWVTRVHVVWVELTKWVMKVCMSILKCVTGVKGRSVEWWKKWSEILKWSGHMEWMEESKMIKREYVSEVEGGNARGWLPEKWRDRVQKYVRKRGEGTLRNLEQARGECLDRERWKFFCRGHPLVGAPRSRCQKWLIDWLV